MNVMNRCAIIYLLTGIRLQNMTAAISIGAAIHIGYILPIMKMSKKQVLISDSIEAFIELLNHSVVEEE
ncbi:MAG: hypothetical protein J5722_05545 [Oscillospiraceae bacterium]|nr:hypothetical protein [Oscillospiraceae bacterium]